MGSHKEKATEHDLVFGSGKFRAKSNDNFGARTITMKRSEDSRWCGHASLKRYFSVEISKRRGAGHSQSSFVGD